MSVTIHLGSMLLGIIIGFIFMAFAILLVYLFADEDDVFFTKGWHSGFVAGRECEKEIIRKQSK